MRTVNSSRYLKVVQRVLALAYTVFNGEDDLQLLFISPELALSDAWISNLTKTKRHLCAIVIDEAHSITKW